LRILLAEDNATNQRVVRLNLESWGHTVVVAADGVEAVDRFGESGGFELILMDTQMPRMNGLEATAAIRRRESAGAHIPIVAMTANVVKGFREECLAAGMDGYVTKPLRRELLAQEMSRVIPDLIVPEPSDRAVLERNPKPTPTQARVAFDDEAFLASVGGSRDMFREIIGVTLKDDVPRLGKALDEAEASGDSDALERAAHAIKGLAAELRAEPCRIAAACLEKSKNADDAAAVRTEFQELEEALKKASQAGS